MDYRIRRTLSLLSLQGQFLTFMKFKIKAFGVAREVLGGNEVTLEIQGNTVNDLRQHLLVHHPDLNGLNSLFIAVNHQYATDQTILAETDEIAIIPPVSGG